LREAVRLIGRAPRGRRNADGRGGKKLRAAGNDRGDERCPHTPVSAYGRAEATGRQGCLPGWPSRT